MTVLTKQKNILHKNLPTVIIILIFVDTLTKRKKSYRLRNLFSNIKKKEQALMRILIAFLLKLQIF